ncbi:hypothetical protein [Herbiconiux sp.]|uniref:hypothetical protein n=1 Tax=Herbiconiux sp. TaxID=1871186 RepID=UPI0025C4E80E|nr:hypothetical protein [Herbiconiux sp.]
MTDKRGFWLAVGVASLAALGFIAIQFVRSTMAGESETLILPALMAISFVPIVFLIAFVLKTMSGWGGRADALRARGTFDVVAPVIRTEQTLQELRRVSPGGQRTMPRTLTLTADSSGVGFWSGRKTPVLEVWFPWSDIVQIRPTITKDVFERYRGLAVTSRWGEATVELPFAVTGSFPFGTRIATSSAIQELIADIEKTNSETGSAEGTP